MNAAANRNDLNATEYWFQVALAKGIQPDSTMLNLGRRTWDFYLVGYTHMI